MQALITHNEEMGSLIDSNVDLVQQDKESIVHNTKEIDRLNEKLKDKEHEETIMKHSLNAVQD